MCVPGTRVALRGFCPGELLPAGSVSPACPAALASQAYFRFRRCLGGCRSRLLRRQRTLEPRARSEPPSPGETRLGHGVWGWPVGSCSVSVSTAARTRREGDDSNPLGAEGPVLPVPGREKVSREGRGAKAAGAAGVAQGRSRGGAEVGSGAPRGWLSVRGQRSRHREGSRPYPQGRGAPGASSRAAHARLTSGRAL